jgi:twitching motility protein PilT
VGQNTKSFLNALRAALREDPDIILVGEMRDYETIGLAVTAAETAHLCFGTLHTQNIRHDTENRLRARLQHQQTYGSAP